MLPFQEAATADFMTGIDAQPGDTEFKALNESLTLASEALRRDRENRAFKKGRKKVAQRARKLLEQEEAFLKKNSRQARPCDHR